jgi:hypothetical protein
MSHARFVEGAIQRAINLLTSAERASMASQAEEANWDAYICSSLGNGTGAGSFMALAAMVKHLLRDQGAKSPQVSGVFIPGSVTRHGPANDAPVAHRVAASGFASLIELQYEFNRRIENPNNGLGKPPEPYKFVGDGTMGWTVYEPWRGNSEHSSAALEESPYDWAFVLDLINSNNIRAGYGDLLDAGGEALKALLGGADSDSRLLDLGRGVDGRFGSLGAKSFVAPTKALTEWARIEQCKRALEWSIEKDLDIEDELHLNLIQEIDLPAGGEGSLGIDVLQYWWSRKRGHTAVSCSAVSPRTSTSSGSSSRMPSRR